MRRSGLFWGGVLIVFGAILLLDNLHLLPFPVWGIFWPAVLIAWGVWMLWRSVVPRKAGAQTLSIPLEGATQARVFVRHGAGRLMVEGGAGSAELLSGTFDDLVHKTRRDGDVLEAHLRSEVEWRWPGDQMDWQIRLAGDVPLMLDVNTGASDAQLDLSGVRVTELNLRTGASAARVTLPANAEFTKVSIGAGAASVNVRVPEGVAARIHGRAGAGAFDVDQQRFPRVQGGYESPDFASAAHRVEIDGSVGAGAITIR